MRTTEPLLPSFENNLITVNSEIFDSSDDRINQLMKEKSDYFNNSNLCQSYGQSNIEKCLIFLFFLIVFSCLILYHYSNHFGSVLFSIICGTIFLNLFSFITYSFFLYKLQSESMFDRIPTTVAFLNDLIISFNLILETAVLILVSFTSTVDWLCFSLFLAKFLIEIYFVIVSIKVFMFCPWSRSIQNITGRFWNSLRILFCCCENEPEIDLSKYHKLDEYESFY